jgi:hypothetical protein
VSIEKQRVPASSGASGSHSENLLTAPGDYTFDFDPNWEFDRNLVIIL